MELLPYKTHYIATYWFISINLCAHVYLLVVHGNKNLVLMFSFMCWLIYTCSLRYESHHLTIFPRDIQNEFWCAPLFIFPNMHYILSVIVPGAVTSTSDIMCSISTPPGDGARIWKERRAQWPFAPYFGERTTTKVPGTTASWSDATTQTPCDINNAFYYAVHRVHNGWWCRRYCEERRSSAVLCKMAMRTMESKHKWERKDSRMNRGKACWTWFLGS